MCDYINFNSYIGLPYRTDYSFIPGYYSMQNFSPISIFQIQGPRLNFYPMFTQMFNPFQTFNLNSHFNWFNNAFSGSNSVYPTPYNDSFYSSEEYIKKENAKYQNYDSAAGKRLARIAKKNSNGDSEFCADYVKKAINMAGLGPYDDTVDAYQMPDLLKNYPKFQEISTSDVNVDELPTGSILIYDKGVEGVNKDFGHVYIKTEDNKGVSGDIEDLIPNPTSEFIPVKNDYV